MIYYDLGAEVEAYSTNINDPIDFDVLTPAHQVHSTNVAKLPDEADSTYGVDALTTNQIGLRIGVRTADCVPILLYDPVQKAVAAVHSGWKGTVANIIASALKRMTQEYGSRAEAMSALIGPCIHQEAFEVGDEVYEAFCQAGYKAYTRKMTNPYAPESEEKWHIDLPGICRAQLLTMGVKHIEVRDECTYCQHETLYSYRHSGLTGREHRIYNCICLKEQ